MAATPKSTGEFVGKSVPDQWLGALLHYVASLKNDTDPWSNSRSEVKGALKPLLPLWIAMYGVVAMGGVVGNLALLTDALRQRRLLKRMNDHHYAAAFLYLANGALADLFKSAIALPLTLTVLLLRNWVLGSGLCFALPMMQDMPIHLSTLSFLMAALDRYRRLLQPMRRPLSVPASIGATWLTSAGVVLPYAFYVAYLDLGSFFGSAFEGMALCAVNVVDDMEEYLRGLFIILFVLPLALIAFLHVRVSAELKARLSSCSSPDGPEGPYYPEDQQEQQQLEEQAHAARERRAHNYLSAMVLVFALCLSPLMLLRLVRQVMAETYDNSRHLDLTFLVLVWLAFVPCCSTPLLYACWRMAPGARRRLLGHHGRLLVHWLSACWRPTAPGRPRGRHRRTSVATLPLAVVAQQPPRSEHSTPDNELRPELPSSSAPPDTPVTK